MTDLIRRNVVEHNGCWLWQAGQNGAGYGIVRNPEAPPPGQAQLPGVPRYVLAHRLSYQLALGPIPPDTYVCHRCDVPLCVNPEHLFLGSARDNTLDAIQKGRRKRAIHT